MSRKRICVFLLMLVLLITNTMAMQWNDGSLEIVAKQDAVMANEDLSTNVIDAGITMKGEFGNDFRWGTSEDEKTLYVFGKGEMYNFDDNEDKAPWNEESWKYETVIVEGEVTSIGDYAFSWFWSLQKVSLPNTITRIGNYAFDGCGGLTTIDLSGITSIGTGAFQNCGFTSVHIPECVESMSIKVFAGCNNITKFTVAEENEHYYADEQGVLFDKDNNTLMAYPRGAEYVESYTIPEGITNLEDGAFSHTQLGTVVFPSTVTYIDNFCCADNNFTTITIPNTVTGIGQGAFGGSKKLTKVTVPGSVKTIEQNAFGGIENLTEVILEDGVDWIHDYAFQGNPNLEFITIPPSVATISMFAFDSSKEEMVIKGYTNSTAEVYANQYGYTFESIGTVELTALAEGTCGAEGNEENVTWVLYNNGVLKISGTGEMADFKDCWDWENCAPWLKDDLRMKIVNVIIEEGVTSIGTYAFDYCEALIDVSYASTVASIGARAFKDTRWANPVVQKDVTYVGSGAFHIPAEFLDSLTVEEGNEAYVIYEGGLYDADMNILLKWGLGDAFEDGEYNVVLPDTVKTIGIDAFCGSIVSAVTLNEGLETIEERGFFNAHCITTLHLPSTLTTVVGDNTLSIDNLTKFTVAEGNTAFWADERGALFTADRKILLYYPQKATQRFYAIPNGVETVKSEALFFNYLEGLLIPASVTSLEREEIELHNPNNLDNRHILLYGYKGSYAEEYAKNNQYKTWDENWNEFKYDHEFLRIPTKHYKRLRIHCPVDVYVYDVEGNVVASVVDEQVLVYNETIYADDMAKMVYLENDSEFTVEIKATDTGTVSYIIEEVTENAEGTEITNIVEFNDIEIVADDVITSDITMLADVEDYVVSKNDDSIEADKVEVEGATQTPDVTDFIKRLYSEIFGREADEGGLNYWVELLESGNITGAKTAEDFIMGEEFQSKEMTNKEYIQIMYKTFFDREADEDGLSYWEGVLAGGATKRGVFVGFANSAEFGAVCEAYGITQGSVSETEPTPTPTPTPAPSEEPEVSDFVKRLYSEIFGREADESGLSYWVDALESGNVTGAKAAEGFIMSDEFQEKEMTNEEYVQIMYRTFFGREADEGGLAYWTDVMANGQSKQVVFIGFANSTEFGELCEAYGITQGSVGIPTEPEPTPTPAPSEEPEVSDFVKRLYSEIFGREADESGLTYWVDALESGNVTGAKAAEGFIMSEEFQEKEMTNEEYVQIMYRTFFGREADEGGLAYWTDVMANGQSKQVVFIGFANSTEFGELCETYGITQGSVELPTEPEPTPTPGLFPSETSVYQAMISLKDEYPEGMPWTNDNYYGWSGGIYSGGYGCAGFAFLLSDAAFGKMPARKHEDVTNIHVGDILRINNDSHSVIVLEVTQEGVVIAEGNYNSSIHWGRTLTYEKLNNVITYVMTRYIEGTLQTDERVFY